MFERDNLSGIEKQSRLFNWFIFPGKALLWVLYMFPGNGYSNTRQSARWARSPLITVIVSCLFWIGLLCLIINIAIERF